MPELTGAELVQLLNSDQRFAGIPVLMLTAKALELDLNRLREEMGVTAVMAKPFGPTELVRQVAECLEKTAVQ